MKDELIIKMIKTLDKIMEEEAETETETVDQMEDVLKQLYKNLKIEEETSEIEELSKLVKKEIEKISFNVKKAQKIKDKYLELCQMDLNSIDVIIKLFKKDKNKIIKKTIIQTPFLVGIIGFISILDEPDSFSGLFKNLDIDPELFTESLNYIPKIEEIEDYLIEFILYFKDNFMEKDYNEIDDEVLDKIKDTLEMIINLSCYIMISLYSKIINTDDKNINEVELANLFYKNIASYSRNEYMNFIKEVESYEDDLYHEDEQPKPCKAKGAILYTNNKVEIIENYEDGKIYIKSKIPVSVEVDPNIEFEFPRSTEVDIKEFDV